MMNTFNHFTPQVDAVTASMLTNASCRCGKMLQTEGDLKWGDCFKCRAKGVGFKFVGAYNTQASFHNDTIRSVNEATERDAAAVGKPITKLSARQELI